MVTKVLAVVGNVVADLKNKKQDDGTKKWDRYTQLHAIGMDVKEIWKWRYFLDWDNKDLLERISPEDMDREHGEYGSFRYFVNWEKWSRTNQAKEMDGRFFLKHLDDLDLIYIFKHRLEYFRILVEEWKIAAPTYVFKKSINDRFVCAINNVDDVIIGIPYEYRKHGRIDFANNQMDEIQCREYIKKSEKRREELRRREREAAKDKVEIRDDADELVKVTWEAAVDNNEIVDE